MWDHTAIIHEPTHLTSEAVIESVSAHGWLTEGEFAQVPRLVTAAKTLMVGTGPFVVRMKGRHDHEGRLAELSVVDSGTGKASVAPAEPAVVGPPAPEPTEVS